MAQRKLKEFDEYKFGPRSVLRPGDRFRVKDGPIYVTDAGEKFPMFERGIFIFQKYCERGDRKWIQARRADSAVTVILWMGRSMRNPDMQNFRRRPYRITRKIREGRRAAPRRRAA